MPRINLGEHEFVLHLSCFEIDTDGNERQHWKFVLSGEEYVRFLMEPMQKLENARHRKYRKSNIAA